MSSSRYPDNNRYPRERSPYRDRRSSTYGTGYPPRSSEPSSRSATDSGAFPPRDVPRGPKSAVDPPRTSPAGQLSSAPSGPRDGRGRGFPGRSDAPPPSLRDAPPLSSSTHAPRDHNTRDHWRADRDRDRDRDFRDRRPSPPRRSPARDTRDFSLNIDRARRNSRDGPPSAGSTYSDPPLPSGSSYRGSGIGRGRGTGRDFSADFRPRGRGFHNDDRDRHHDPRDARSTHDRMYRPRSRSRDPVRRERDLRDDREFDRRDRDDRRFERREDEPRRYDSYQGSASFKPAVRTLDTHRGSVSTDPRNLPGTPTGPSTPHSTHHPATSDRVGPSADPYSRRSSTATEPLSAKDARRESDRNDLIASRAEFSKERYAPRASSPPAAVPAFGFSNVWRNPALDTKSTPTTQVQKPAVVTPSAPTAPAVAAPAPPQAPPQAQAPPPASKPAVPSGLSALPPTGPKADRVPERTQDVQAQENKAQTVEQARVDPPPRPAPASTLPPASVPASTNVESKPQAPVAPQAISPSLGLGPKSRPPPAGPQVTTRPPNVSPSFSRPQLPSYAPSDASPGPIPSGPRNALSVNTSPKASHVNIPTGPKADRGNPMASRPPMYATPDRPPFSERLPFAGARIPPVKGGPASMQWVRPGLNRPSTIPTKREFPNDDRDRTFGNAPKAPKLESSVSAGESQRFEQKPTTTTNSGLTGPSANHNNSPRTEQRSKTSSPKPSPIKIRRMSDVSMAGTSPRTVQPPISATSSAPEAMEDSDDDLDLDEEDFAESEARYNRDKARLESKCVDLSAPHWRVTDLLQEIMMLSNITPEHLPQQAPRTTDEDMVSPMPAQPPPESITTDLPTPKAEETEDVEMEDKTDYPMAPATRALRLRQEISAERETTPPDYSSLPYLGSGPPTPLSDPDQERPSVPDSVLLAIKDNLQRDIAPEQDPQDVLSQYAAAYKTWRLHVYDLDDERETDDPERQPSAEPTLKVPTPGVQSTVVTALLDIPPQTTGRRGHSKRFASEFDFEQAIKESLKTAEEERMGKKEKEPKKALWDPEREAIVLPELTEYEARRRRFIDTNFQREPGQGVFVYHYEPPEDDFTEVEHKVMVQHYRDQYAKKWGKLAEILYKEAGTSRTYKDTINHYYATKWGKEYKHKAKRGRGGARRRGATGRGRGAAANVDRSEPPTDDPLAPQSLTDSGRPRRQAAPTFGGDAEFDSSSNLPTPGRQRRTTDVDSTQEKAGRRGKPGKEKGGRKLKNQPLAAAPAGSPIKMDKKERGLGVKSEEDPTKRAVEIPSAMPPGLNEDQFGIQMDPQIQSGMPNASTERPRSHTNSRPGPSSYWSVTEQNDFHRNVAHFGTDFVAIANHMGTKTHTMVKNQYLRLIESGANPDLAKLANEADQKRDRGEDLGPPPTPTPAPKRRYESSQTTLPRTLAPTPEVTELLKSPPTQPVVNPKFSPTHSTPNRFPPLAQGPPQTKPIIPSSGSSSIPEGIAAIPSSQHPSHQSPPAQAPRSQLPHHQPPQAEAKPHHPPPRGYFSDNTTARVENRLPGQVSNLGQPSRILQQQQQQIPPPHARGQDPSQTSIFRSAVPSEREAPSRLDQPQDHDTHSRFPQHSRRISQENTFHRQFQPTAPGPSQVVPSMRSISGAGSPESRPLLLQQSRHVPHAQPSVQPPPEVSSQAPGSMVVPPPLGPRSSLGTPPVKEEGRHYPPPPAPPSHSQPMPQVPTQPTKHSQSSQPIAHPPVAPPAPKPATEPPRKSNLFALMNDTEPEEPKRKPTEVPSHTPTPQQQTPIAPPPVSQAMAPRRDPFSDPSSAQPPYPRPAYGQPAPQSHGSSARQIVDLTSEQSGSRWQQRQQTYHMGQSQAPQSSSLNSPHTTLNQPTFGDARRIPSHRAFLVQHNDPRHNPSPPPISAFGNSPHLHSRTPSLSGPSSQQARHGMSSSTPGPGAQGAAGTSQILQPNPYAQVDPTGPGTQPSGPVGMRPSPHLHTSHVAQQREVQSRDPPQVHNPNLPYSNPQTPSEHHPSHSHLRGPSVNDPYRPRDPREPRDLRDPRDYHEFNTRNHERDMSRELQERADVLLREREQRESLSRPGPPSQLHQDSRYQPTPGPDRVYPPAPRSHTPLSRSEHPSLSHPQPHSMLPESGRPAYGQRPEEPRHTYPNPYGRPRDDQLTERIREEQAQQARLRGGDEFLNRDRDQHMRNQEFRDTRYRDEIMRRDQRLPGGLPPTGPSHGQPGHEQARSHGPPGMDWTSAVPRPQEGWRR